MEKSIEQFLQHLRAHKRNAQTISNYRFYLKRFTSWAKLETPSDITRDTIQRYRQWLSRDLNRYGKTLSTSTQNYHLIALRSFLKFLSAHGTKTMPARAVVLAHLPTRRITIVETQELERLLEAPLQADEPRIIQLRDKAILELLFSTGLRVSELAHLTPEAINAATGTITIPSRTGKRTVRLSNATRHWLSQYQKAKKNQTKYIFVRHDRAQRGEPKHLTPRSIQRLVKQYSRDVGVAVPVTPRVVRSSVAARLLSRGTALTAVQTMLGHLSKATTAPYRLATSIAAKRNRGLFGWKKKR